MRFLLRALLFLILIGGIVVGAAYFVAGYQGGPAIEVKTPEKYIGQNSALEFSVDTPAGQLPRVDAVLEQEGQSTQVVNLDPSEAATYSDTKQASADRIWISRPIGKKTVPTLKTGPARLTITASRPVLYGLRNVTTTETRDLDVRLDPPRVGVVSLHHFVNHGSAEFVVFRATPADVSAGVRVGETSFPAFPGSSVGINDPAVRIAFFALGYDQDRNSPMTVFARDVAGNEAIANLEHRVFPKPFAKSNIEIDEGFMQRVVPDIAQNSPDANVPTDDLLAGFLKINGEMRRQNNKQIAEMATKTRPEMLFREAFSLGNINVEARFADFRTYFHKGKEIDRQVHLGFDLATLQHAPVPAANRGIVIHANFLGIYGNTVVLDHGLGVQSLYGHMSMIEVKEGQNVEKGQTLGRTGTTGLAGGDHLHFTMLVSGVMVNPVEWWDPHWIEDRVFRKIREAGGQAPAPPGAKPAQAKSSYN